MNQSPHVTDRFAPGRRIVRAAEFGVIEEVAHLIEAANRDAEAIRADARGDAEAMLARTEIFARKQSERGYADGWAHAQHEFAATLTRAQAGEAHRAGELEDRLGLMVTRTLNKILAEEVHDERFFASVVPRVLRAVRDAKYLVLRVAPDQRAAAQAAVEAATRGVGAPEFIDVRADAALERGACVVESPHGVIDASLATQLETIRQAISTAWRPESEA